LYSVKCACYHVKNVSMRLILTRAELQLSLRGAQTRLVSFHTPVHAVSGSELLSQGMVLWSWATNRAAVARAAAFCLSLMECKLVGLRIV
jgi:hypothetical protein